MIRILVLSILTFVIYGAMSRAYADSTTMPKAAEFRFENIHLAQSGEDRRIGKEEVPRPKLPPGPRDGNEN